MHKVIIWIKMYSSWFAIDQLIPFVIKSSFLNIKVDVLKAKLLSSNVSFHILIGVDAYATGTKFDFVKSNFDDENFKSYFGI